jgi:hypothetical protein
MSTKSLPASFHDAAMSAKGLMAQAADLRREARKVFFLGNGDTPMHAALVAAAVALERAAQEQARHENAVNYKRRSA